MRATPRRVRRRPFRAATCVISHADGHGLAVDILRRADEKISFRSFRSQRGLGNGVAEAGDTRVIRLIKLTPLPSVKTDHQNRLIDPIQKRSKQPEHLQLQSQRMVIQP